jgi:hypothetical protein
MLTRFKLVHVSGRLPRRATYCLQGRFDAAKSGPSCTFGGKRAKTATPYCRRTTEQWRNISISLIDPGQNDRGRDTTHVVPPARTRTGAH